MKQKNQFTFIICSYLCQFVLRKPSASLSVSICIDLWLIYRGRSQAQENIYRSKCVMEKADTRQIITDVK